MQIRAVREVTMPSRRNRGFEMGRVYDASPKGPPHGSVDPPLADNYVVFVDRLWPRGISKDDAPWDEWAKDLAPGSELRRWYGHDPARFEEFARRYREELRRPPGADAVARISGLGRKRRVVLLTATRDIDHSGARVLRDVLAEKEP
jgi:uncharacterized protein YeaO (DUF488 family)